MAARSCFVRRRSVVAGGDFLMGLSGPFPGADLPGERASRGGAVKDGEATASRREASVTVPTTARSSRPDGTQRVFSPLSVVGPSIRTPLLSCRPRQRRPWKIASRSFGYRCTFTIAFTTFGRSGLSGIRGLRFSNDTQLSLPTMRSSWTPRVSVRSRPAAATNGLLSCSAFVSIRDG
jgi:hypothetical protein